MTALPDWEIASDADLAGAAAGGNRGAFACIYDRYANRLHDFCVGMLRDREAAADCVQDVFCTAAAQLPKLREHDKLRPWLYAIARHEALRYLRERRREQACDDIPDEASGEAGPDVLVARTELANMLAQAAGGLTDRDRTVLELAYHHGMDGAELAEALGVSNSTANRMVSRLRETVERSLGALLVARGVQRDPDRCPELAAILADWDGQLSVLMRKRIAHHIESCPNCEQQRRRLVNPAALLGAVPMFIPAPAWLRDHTLGQIQLCAASVPAPVSPSGQPGDPQGGSTSPRTRQLQLVALAAATVFAAMTLTMAWLHHEHVHMSPSNLAVANSNLTAPESASPAATPVATPIATPVATPEPSPVQTPAVATQTASAAIPQSSLTPLPTTVVTPPSATPPTTPPATPATPATPPATPVPSPPVIPVTPPFAGPVSSPPSTPSPPSPPCGLTCPQTATATAPTPTATSEPTPAPPPPRCQPPKCPTPTTTTTTRPSERIQ